MGIHTYFMEEKRTKIPGSIRSILGNRGFSSFLFPKPNSYTNRPLFLRKSKGFTLIELLIVIAIIGILSSLLITVVNPSVQLKRSRDSHRKSDLKLIQAGLELYRSDQGSYPSPNSDVPPGVNNCGSALVFDSNLPASCDPSNDTTYIQSVPIDPSTKKDYYYCTDTSCGATSGGYALYACIENSSDTDATGTISSLGLSLYCLTGVTKYVKVTNP